MDQTDFFSSDDELHFTNIWDDWDQDEYDRQKDDQFNFVWVTQDGRELILDEMDSRHLCNCVRMIFNHSVPAQYATGPHRHYPCSAFWSTNTRRMVLVAMLQELRKRTDVSKRDRDDLAHMASVVDALLKGRFPQLKLKTKRTFDEI